MGSPVVIAYVVDVHDRFEAVPEAIAGLGDARQVELGVGLGRTRLLFGEVGVCGVSAAPISPFAAVAVDGELSVRLDGDE
jgi:hypothetical protein